MHGFVTGLHVLGTGVGSGVAASPARALSVIINASSTPTHVEHITWVNERCLVMGPCLRATAQGFRRGYDLSAAQEEPGALG